MLFIGAQRWRPEPSAVVNNHDSLIEPEMAASQ
jgi:hypothetical protein